MEELVTETECPTSVLDTRCVECEEFNCCFFFGGVVDKMISNSLYKCDTRMRSIQLIRKNNPLPARTNHSLCYSNDKLLVFGGRDEEGHCLNDLWSYSICDDLWERLFERESFPYMEGHSSVVYKDYLYLIGLEFHTGDYNILLKKSLVVYRINLTNGCLEQFSDTVFKFTSVDNDQPQTPLSFIELNRSESEKIPCSRHACSSFVYNDCIIVVGGISNSEESLGDIWQFSPHTNDWTCIYTDKDSCRLSPGSSVSMFQSHLVFYGGFHSMLYAFDLERHSWNGPFLQDHEPLTHHATCILREENELSLLVIGGSLSHLPFINTGSIIVPSSTNNTLIVVNLTEQLNKSSSQAEVSNPYGSTSIEEEVSKIEMIKTNDLSQVLADYRATTIKDLFRQDLSSLFSIRGNNGYRSSIDYACTPKNQVTEFTFTECYASPCYPRKVPSPMSPKESISPLKPSGSRERASGIPYIPRLRELEEANEITDFHLAAMNGYMSQSSDSSTPNHPQVKKNPFSHSHSNTGTTLSAIKKPVIHHQSSQSLNWPGMTNPLPSRPFSPMPSNQPIPNHYRSHRMNDGNSFNLSISPRQTDNSGVKASLRDLTLTPFTNPKEEQNIPSSPLSHSSSIMKRTSPSADSRFQNHLHSSHYSSRLPTHPTELPSLAVPLSSLNHVLHSDNQTPALHEAISQSITPPSEETIPLSNSDASDILSNGSLQMQYSWNEDYQRIQRMCEKEIQEIAEIDNSICSFESRIASYEQKVKEIKKGIEDSRQLMRHSPYRDEDNSTLNEILKNAQYKYENRWCVC